MDSADKETIKITISSANSALVDSLIPAALLKKTFTAFLSALTTAGKEIGGKPNSFEFFIKDLKMRSNVLELEERTVSRVSGSPIALLKSMMLATYRSQPDQIDSDPVMAKCISRLAKLVNADYEIKASFADEEVPIDTFFASQAKRFAENAGKKTDRPLFFVGPAIGTFDGYLKAIDYRGTTWSGYLVLHGGRNIQIQCIFDKSKGSNEINQHGNKKVSITGTAIYTGESALPERIEVREIRGIDESTEYKDIGGTLRGSDYSGWNDGFETIK